MRRLVRSILLLLTLAALLGGSPAGATPVPHALRLLRGSDPSPQAPAAGCGYNTSTTALLADFSSGDWLAQVRALSGADPVTLPNGITTITTRYTPRLFDGSPHARAYDYVLYQLQQMGYPASAIEQDAWSASGISGMNLTLTIPGLITPTEVVALTAHLDSLSPPATRDSLAPGAEDNASGSAALLEAADALRTYQYDRTLKLIWFTGEEQGMLGSAAYVNDHSTSGYQGVVNLDMFGYDSDNDRCIELHVGTLAASNAVGQCFLEGVAAYGLNLSADYITSGATSSSDHSPFWQHGVGAIEVLENHFYNPGMGCGGRIDSNPYYHTVNDTVANSFPPYSAGQPNSVGADIARAGLAAAVGMAGNRGACFSEAPWLTLDYFGRSAQLSWTSLPGASGYRLYRQVDNGPWVLKYSGGETQWTDTGLVVGFDHEYRVFGVAADGICQSPAGQTSLIWIVHPQMYLPVVRR
jgi:leucyl aminopeptidase